MAASELARSAASRWGGRALGAGFGFACLAGLLSHFGSDDVFATLGAALPWLPLVLVLEASRNACELMAARALLGEKAGAVPIAVLVRSHLVAYSVSLVAPAGRAAQEATKAALLKGHVGGPSALAMGTSNQVLNLWAEAALSALTLGLSFAYAGSTWLRIGLAAHVVVCAATGTVLRAAAVSERSTRWVARFRRVAEAAPEFRRRLREHRLLKPAAWFLAGKLQQVVLLLCAFSAVGSRLAPGKLVVAQGLSAIASAVGDLVPAQIGTTDGIFAASSAELGVSAALALSATLLLHSAQIVWIAIGALAAAVWKLPATTPVAPPVPLDSLEAAG